jgi:hypothetical protein
MREKIEMRRKVEDIFEQNARVDHAEGGKARRQMHWMKALILAPMLAGALSAQTLHGPGDSSKTCIDLDGDGYGAMHTEEVRDFSPVAPALFRSPAAAQDLSR